MANKKMAFSILCMFDYQANTGFATVSQNIIRELEEAFGDRLYMDIIAVNYFGDPIVTTRKKVYSAVNTDGKHDAFGRNQFLAMLATFDYDGVFIINDLGVVSPIIEIMEHIKAEKKKKKKKAFKSIFYFPIDAPHLQHEFSKLHFFDLLVPYTEFARKQILQHRPELASKMKVILHGVNHKDFGVMSPIDKKEFRDAYFGDNANRFIIGNVNRNQPRKGIPETIFGFDEYRQRHNPDALLYLHMHPKDELGYNIRLICDQLGLEENKHYMFPAQELIDEQPEPGFLSCIYNALDVYLTTTTGEGFGLTILEAMQCGCPVIAPYNSSIMEISGYDIDKNRIHLLFEQFPMAQHFDNIIRYQCDPLEVAEKINEVRNMDWRKDRTIENALEYSQSLNWKIVCQRWVEEFKKLF
jgi:D-inositol-3-phosphate glycosyltransferase